MNPFDLPGPAFLFLYALIAIGLHLAFRPLLRLLLRKPGAQMPTPAVVQSLDPYLIAYLRGQTNETARVAIMSLIDRGLLRVEGEKLTSNPGADNYARRAVERAIVRTFTMPRPASTIFADNFFRSVCGGLEAELQGLSLIPGYNSGLWTMVLRLFFAGVLLATAIIKISLAIDRGHDNVVFLVLLALGTAVPMLFRKRLVRTAFGDRVLKQLEQDYALLRARLSYVPSGGSTTELVMSAAVFGLTALPENNQALAQQLFPAAMNSTTSSSGGCGGTSCGSSSCGSSSCGGGGCGGGCGGCGG